MDTKSATVGAQNTSVDMLNNYETRKRPIRFTVCTSYPADREPRGPRHARALADRGCCEVVFVDAAPFGHTSNEIKMFRDLHNFRHITHYFSTRNSNALGWIGRKLQHSISKRIYKYFGKISNSALNPCLNGFEDLLVSTNPDVIMAHNIDTLFPAYLAAKRCRAKLIFDSMEFHSDMGDGQDSFHSQLVKRIESECLPACSLITTSSHRVADALREAYAVKELIALYNTPPIEKELPETKIKGFGLYWRNSTIGFGQRGLEDAMRALPNLPQEITLNLQGRAAADGGAAVIRLATELGIQHRVVIHPPYKSELAVLEASRFHVGLCLERNGIRNHELTVSNKMFDYHMAGLAVISSDLPALRDIIERSGGGLTYVAGDVDDLRRQIMALYTDVALLKRLSSNARGFAIGEGNSDVEMLKFNQAIVELIGSINAPR